MGPGSWIIAKGYNGSMQLSGELTKVSFPNLLQLVRSGGLTGRLSLSQGARMALILVKGGLPYHVDMEGLIGREGLYELFLWQSGTFSFSEEDLGAAYESVSFDGPEETFDRLLKEGLNYLEDQQLLKNMGVDFDSVLVSKVSSGKYDEVIKIHPGLDRLDGIRSVGDAMASLDLTRRELVHTIASWLSEGFAEPMHQTVAMHHNQVMLPDWVVARLKQDSDDLSSAIVEMVIWVDRVKCWMYQADADLERILEEARKNARDRKSQMGQAAAPPGQII